MDIVFAGIGNCVVCRDPNCSTHHIYFKSQYMKSDREKSWNKCSLCERHHRIIHHASTDAEVKEKCYLDYSLKTYAYIRYQKRKEQPGISDLEYELRKSKYKLKKYENNTDGESA